MHSNSGSRPTPHTPRPHPTAHTHTPQPTPHSVHATHHHFESRPTPVTPHATPLAHTAAGMNRHRDLDAGLRSFVRGHNWGGVLPQCLPPAARPRARSPLPVLPAHEETLKCTRVFLPPSPPPSIRRRPGSGRGAGTLGCTLTCRIPKRACGSSILVPMANAHDSRRSHRAHHRIQT